MPSLRSDEARQDLEESTEEAFRKVKDKKAVRCWGTGFVETASGVSEIGGAHPKAPCPGCADCPPESIGRKRAEETFTSPKKE